MKILYIKLINFKRFPLNDSRVFEYTFNKDLTIITGQNGAGKSSLFNELTPLPSNKNDFYDNGYKEIHIEHNKQIYKLISDFTSGVKYSFIIDENNLNIQQNISTQKELVYKHFKINDLIHDILIGKETFTEMSLPIRKKLFNNITHLNIDAILTGYNSLKEEYKNNELLLKNYILLHDTENDKIKNKDKLDMLNDNYKRINNYINVLLEIRDNLLIYRNTNTDIDTLCNNINNISLKIDDIIHKNYIYLTSHYKDNINNYKSEISTIDYKLEDLYKKLEFYQNTINSMFDIDTDTSSILNRINKLKSDNIKIEESLSLYKDINMNYENIKSELYKLESILPDILRTIPLNENSKYSKEKYDKCLELIRNTTDELVKKEKNKVTIKSNIEAINNAKEVICPSCNYKWNILNENNELDNLNKSLLDIDKEINICQNELNNLNKELEEITNYFSIYRQYNNIRKSTYDTLSTFWNIVDSNRYIFISPLEILKLLNSTIMNIVNIETLQNNISEINTLNKELDRINILKNNDILAIKNNISNIESDIDYLINKKRNIETMISDNNISLGIRNSLNTLQNQLKRSINDLFSGNVSFTISEILNALEAELNKNKISIVEIEKELLTYKNIQYTIDKYQEQINSIKNTLYILDLILKELSPKNGIIAKSVNSFLNIIITNINTIIEKVWNYKMILTTIDIDNEILNYKFKVNVENKITIDDISKTSSGMRKIINFSFVILLYKLLKLENYPLFLDEFTTNLDENHSQKFGLLVNQLLMNSNYSQIFIISHIQSDLYFGNKELNIVELG